MAWVSGMFELAIILFLLVFNGVFAMTEIALVTAKRSRLKQRADAGNAGALLALRLTENPERFLSTVQIGITLVGVLAGAFGGASLAGYVAPLLKEIPMLAAYADQIAFGLVVAGITYLSLIIGELVPKNLALRNPEAIASSMAGPMNLLSRVASPMVWVLELSTRAVMRLFGKAPENVGPSRDEVEVLIREGIITGGVRADESEMVEGVFDLREIRAEEIMRPKPKVLFLAADALSTTVVEQVVDTRQLVFPVFEGSRDHVVGLVSLRSLYRDAATGQSQPMSALMNEPVFVSDNQPALSLLALLRHAPLFAAVVTDEFGIVRGMVTLEDLVEEVVGDLPFQAHADDSVIRQTGPDSWLVDGLTEIDQVVLAIPDLETQVEAEQESFQTLAGYILHQLERLPIEGESFTVGHFQFEIIDMDRQKIDKVAIQRLPTIVVGETAEVEA
jgi:putative hemolysin